MSRSIRDYPGITRPNRTTCNHNRSFPQKREWWDTVFTAKKLPSNGEAVSHLWLLFLAWRNRIFCYCCKLISSGYPLAQHSIPLLTAGTTLVHPFWSGRYLAVVIIWFVGFNRPVHCSLRWRGLGVTLSGLASVTSPISIITSWCTLSRISTHHGVGPRKSVSNRALHLLKPALLVIAAQPVKSRNERNRDGNHKVLQWTS